MHVRCGPGEKTEIKSKSYLSVSHAAAYAMVSYMTAYLKYHYPEEYLCAMFNNKEQKSFGPIIEDCSLYGIEILPLSINRSYYDFVTENGCIRFGIKGLKGIKSNAPIDGIIQLRESSRKVTPFQSFDDFIIRTAVTNINGKVTLLPKDIMAPLILCGAFDEHVKDREKLYEYYEKISRMSNSIKSEYQLASTLPGYDDGEKNVTFNRKEEMEYMGFVVSENPLKEYMDDDYYGCYSMDDMPSGGYGSVFGIVIEVMPHKSKNGKDMLILNVQGKTGTARLLAMGQVYDKYSKMDMSQKVFRFTGKFSDKTMFVNKIEGLYAKRKEYILYCDTKEKMRQAMKALENPGFPEADLRILCMYGGREGNIPIESPQVTNHISVSMEVVKRLGCITEKRIGI